MCAQAPEAPSFKMPDAPKLPDAPKMDFKMPDAPKAPAFDTPKFGACLRRNQPASYVSYVYVASMA